MDSSRPSLQQENPGPIAAAAAAWIARRDAGFDEAQRAQLRSWLAADPRHAAAFAQADSIGGDLVWPLRESALDRVLTELSRRARRRRRSAIRAAGALGLLVAVLWNVSIFSSPSADLPRLIVTTPDHRILSDGTTVDLQEGARITVNYTDTGRFVTLTQGGAHFQVTKDTRPFVVSAAGITACALGTAFSVELKTGIVSVLVTEGRVAVDSPEYAPRATAQDSASAAPAPLALLEAGNAISVNLAENAPPSATEVTLLPPAELADRISWRIPRIEFNSTPLSAVVAQVNAHNTIQFVIVDPSLADLKLSGSLRADKMDALVEMLETDLNVRTKRTRDRIIIGVQR